MIRPLEEVVMGARPLQKHRLLHEATVKETVSVGNALFWRNRCEAANPHGLVGAQFNGINFGSVSIAYLEFGTRVTIEPDPNDQHLIVQTTLGGHSATRNGTQQIVTGRDDIAILDASLPTRISFEAGCAHLALKIDRSLLELKLQELLQHPLNRPLQFELKSDQNRATRTAWLQTLNFLCTYYDRPEEEVLQNQYLLQSHMDTIATTLITSQPHNYSEWLDNDRYSAAPRHVRRACEYIEAHIKQVISMSDLCQVCHVTERTLQNGFKRHLGLTPNAFIQARRLHHLHLALQKANGRGNVSSIMWDHGISNPGRWAKLYMLRYGCSPSQTFNQKR